MCNCQCSFFNCTCGCKPTIKSAKYISGGTVVSMIGALGMGMYIYSAFVAPETNDPLSKIYSNLFFGIASCVNYMAGWVFIACGLDKCYRCKCDDSSSNVELSPLV